MAMVIMHNMAASEALHTLNKNASKLAKDLKKVASGRKIGGAGDDASAYAISERMRVQIHGLDQAKANAQNANSLMRTAEGAVQSTTTATLTAQRSSARSTSRSIRSMRTRASSSTGAISSTAARIARIRRRIPSSRRSTRSGFRTRSRSSSSRTASGSTRRIRSRRRWT